MTVSLAYGQVTGSLTGSVVDPQGKAIPNATVSLYRPDGSVSLIQAVANSSGVFTLETISPQIYKVVIEAPGFAPVEIKELRVSPGVPTVLNNQVLQVGAQAQVIEASAQLESVQTTTAQIVTTLSNEQLRELPQFLRDPLQLIQTQTGVSANRRTSTTINGLRPTYNNVTLEGVSIQDNYYRARSLDYLPNRLFIDQISEFTLITSNQSATYGNGAAQVAFAIPSGTNSFHGQALYMVSPNNLNANEWFDNAQRNVTGFKNSQGGFSVGGPILANKLFFYVNYELLRYRDSAATVVFSPTAATRASVTNAAMKTLLDTIPLPNVATTQAVGLYRYSAPDRRNRDNVSGKLDFFASERHSFGAAYSWNREKLDDLNLNFVLPVAPIRSDNNRNFGVASWRATLSPTFVNEVRAGVNVAPITYTRVGATPPYRVFLPSYLGLPVGVPLLLQDANDPTRRSASSTINLYGNDLASERESKTINIQDNASWTKGRHNLTFGFQSQLVRADRTSLLDTVPAYQIADFRAGKISRIEQRFGFTSQTSGYVLGAQDKHKYQYDNYAGYFQDQLRLSSRLTTILGLRYDYYTPARDTTGLFLIPNLRGDNPINTLLSPDSEYRFTSGDLYKTQKNNFAPYVGVAYDPFGTGKTVIRGAYSMSYVNDDMIRALESSISNNGGASGYRFQTFSEQNAPALGDTISPLTPPQLPNPITAQALGRFYVEGPYQSVSMIDPNLRTPYVQQWSFGVQQNWLNTIIEARYVGNHATGMLREVDLNQPDLRGSGFLSDFVSLRYDLENGRTPASTRLLSHLATLNDADLESSAGLIVANAAGQLAYNIGAAAGYNLFRNTSAWNGATYLGNFSHSTYNAFQFDARHRMQNGFQFQGNYTFSKVLSDSGRVASSAYEPYRDAFNPKLDRARAPFDLRHAIKMNFVYELPFGPGRRFNDLPLQPLFGGWSVSGILGWQSGTPFSILSGLASVQNLSKSFNNTADALVPRSQIDSALGVLSSGNGPYFFSPSTRNADGTGTDLMFGNPGAGNIGTLQLRSFSGPWVSNVNLGVQKKTRITERQSIDLRFEALNAFNHPTWYVGDQNINRTDFGRIYDTFYPARKVQLALFYRF